MAGSALALAVAWAGLRLETPPHARHNCIGRIAGLDRSASLPIVSNSAALPVSAHGPDRALSEIEWRGWGFGLVASSSP
jgi:hypothetical protein